MSMSNAISWFEIPVANLKRANEFYAKVLGKPLNHQIFGADELHVFPYERPGVGGCVMHSKLLQPSQQGVMIYLATDELDSALQRVVPAGGSIALGRTELPEGIGFYAHIVDSEGNRVGLHAMR